MINTPTKIIVHHSADTQQGDQLAKINEWHKHIEFTQSSLGYYVGYHYLINHAGIVTQTRKDTDEGCHTIGQNLSSIGICLEGNFSEEEPTAEQELALGKLLVEKCGEYDIPYQRIFPHRHFSKKECFGTKLPDTWASIVAIQTDKFNSKEIQICS